MPRQISRATARRFLIKRQLLDPPRSMSATPENVMAVVDRLGSLQFDPLEVAGRNHDLVLAARLDGYRREIADELLYGSRQLYEAYNKSLNLLPTRDLPRYRISWQWAQNGRSRDLLEAHRALADRVLGDIRDDGPKCSLDFEREAAIDWWWGPTTAVRAVLEALWVTGVVSLSRRDGNRRYYDLTERLYPAELLAEEIPERDQMRHRLLSRYRGHGLLGQSGSGELWIGAGKAEPRTALRDELVERGELVPLRVEDVKGTRFAIGSETPLLDAAEEEVAAGRRASGVAFVAPLDPLMWDRALLGPLWSFDYIWEVYTPEAKRRWGYYVLPLLFGDRLVGRIEPRIDRRASVVRILGLSFEPGFDPMAEPGFVDSFAEALRAYLAFAGAGSLERSGAAISAAHRALFRELSSSVPMKRATTAPSAGKPAPGKRAAFPKVAASARRAAQP